MERGPIRKNTYIKTSAYQLITVLNKTKHKKHPKKSKESNTVTLPCRLSLRKKKYGR